MHVTYYFLYLKGTHMSVVLTCLLIATIMPILAKAPLAYVMNKCQGGYDNRNPREQQKVLTGLGARAKAAHENCFEALIMFTPGALATLITNNIGSTVEHIAMTFIGVRVLYLLAYYFDFHIARSLFWSIGFAASVALLYLAIH